VVSGAVLAAALWFAARFAALHFALLSTLRDEAALGSLVAVGAIVYFGSILLLFGRRWLSLLLRSA
jgi:putative peptidoglycan lipid II flippase